MPINNYITSLYGNRTNPITNKEAFHSGIDINGYEGQKVYAMFQGEITEKYYSETYGNVLVYEGEFYNQKIKVFMAHLDKSMVNIGDIIHKGDFIAIVGNTGNSTGTHLHLSTYINEKLFNPLYILSDTYFN